MTTKTDHFENQISISISPHPPCTPPPFKARHGIHFALLSQDRDKFGLVFLSISNHSELTFELTIRTSAYVKSPFSCGISGPSKSSPWPTVYWHPLMAFHLIITAAIHMSFRTINLLCWVSYTAKSSISLRSWMWPTAKTSQIFLKSGSIFRYFFAAEAFHFSPPEMWNSALWEKGSIGWKIDSKTKQEVTNADKEIVVQKGAQLGKYFCQEKNLKAEIISCDSQLDQLL